MFLQHTFWRRAVTAAEAFSRSLRSLRRPRRSFSDREARRGNLVRSETGSSLVEFAICCPVLFGFVFGLMQVSLAFYTHEYISELAREGTRWAMVRGSGCSGCTASTSSVEAYVSSIGLPNLAGGKMHVVASYPDGNETAPDPVEVTVTYIFPYKIPFVTSSNLTMTSRSEMPIVQ